MDKGEEKDLYVRLIELEYLAMRDEIRSSHSHIYLSLQICFALVAASVTIAVNMKAYPVLIHIILSIFVPFVCFTTIMMILSESIRMKRAGDYICFLEKKSELLFQDNAFFRHSKTWDKTQINIEKWLHLEKSDLKMIAPLCYEQWIRESNVKKAYYGRGNFLTQIRFLIIFAIALFSILYSEFFLEFDFESIDHTSWFCNIHLGIRILAFLSNGMLLFYTLFQGISFRKNTKIIHNAKISVK